MKKKVLLLFLSLFVTAQMYAQLGEGPQIPNNDFETWDNSSSNIEPQHWSSLMTANVTVIGGSAGQQQVVFKETTNLPPNTTGNSCAKLKSKQISILGLITVTANGNMTTGRINMGATSSTETKNCSYTKKGDNDFSMPFTYSPDSIYFWAKTSSSSNNARINAVIHNDVLTSGATDNACYQDPMPSGAASTGIVGTNTAGNEAKVVAKATQNFKTNGNWQYKQLAFDYNFSSNDPKYMLITFSTSEIAGGGTAGDELYIDDIVMVYNTRLTSLALNNNTIDGFNPDVTTYSNINWCPSQPSPESQLTWTCASPHATATISHAATATEPYTIITVNQSGATKDYRIDYTLITVETPTVTTPEPRCISGALTSIELSATPATGTTCQWFETETGDVVESGNTYTATDLSTTTTFYVASYDAEQQCASARVPLVVTLHPEYAFTENVSVCESDLPYEWHGQQLSANGTYTDSFQSIYGCDSTYTLTLTIAEVGRYTDPDIYLCEGSTVEWRDITITEAGTYMDTVSSGSNCSNIYEVLVIAVSNYDISESVTVCENELPYEWNNQSLVEEGTYTEHLTSAFGCDSIVNLTLTIAPTYEINIVDTAYVNEPYENYGISQTFYDTTAQSFELTEITGSGCDSIIHLDIVVLDRTGLQEATWLGSITIFPNPADENMMISAEDIILNEITLFDHSGRKVLHEMVNRSTILLNVDTLAPGVYLMQIASDNGLITKKVVIR
ncbi:MAG: T9SS type A sorting domain-containing protein [Bacteroidales bacterium]|nr:T9SS type A sorting domain-containing protein [Bacteroidales bacterium]